MIETTTDDNLTTTETVLLHTWARALASLTGALARTHGWPEITLDQAREMNAIGLTALDAFVRGFRSPEAKAPNFDELDAVFEGMALGLLERVMGLPAPADVVH